MADKTANYADRQYPLVALVEFDFETFTEDQVDQILDMPAGAVITGIALQVLTAWDNTSPVFNVGLDSADPDVFLDAVDISAEGNFTVSLFSADDDAALFTGDANVFVTPDTINVLYAAGAGTATAGEAKLIVEYVISDRSNENQG